jgi:hypothetical protein
VVSVDRERPDEPIDLAKHKSGDTPPAPQADERYVANTIARRERCGRIKAITRARRSHMLEIGCVSGTAWADR